ncbi:hypothetical protein [Planotetraspora sp. GP83]|uniref:hypothetical protein n=1 Tax=Planotetraspora sp. GP83 TaxID=3156264 RepID=UPI00351792FC
MGEGQQQLTEGQEQVRDPMFRQREEGTRAGVVVTMRRLALTMLPIALSGMIAHPSSANATGIQWTAVRQGHHGHRDGHGHNVLVLNNNKKIGSYAPVNIVDSATVVEGMWHVNSASQNTSTQSGVCKDKHVAGSPRTCGRILSTDADYRKGDKQPPHRFA